MKIVLLFLIIIYQHQKVTCQVVRNFVTGIGSAIDFVAAVIKGLAVKLQEVLLSPENSVTAKNPASMHRFGPPITIIPAMSKSLKNTVPEPEAYKQLIKHPTALLPTDRLISFHRRVPEIHMVITADGYVVTLHRVIQTSKSTNKTILLHHGLLGSSADWVMLGAQDSLPYRLHSVGYDVWMTNARGNYYSQNHVNLSVVNKNFWNFTWQEMGQSDLPAVIDYIRKVKGNQVLIDYIGHSMGASALLVLLSTSTAYNSYIRVGVLLAPLVFMTGAKGPIRALAEKRLLFSQYTTNQTNGEYFPTRKVPYILAKSYCKGHRLYCYNPLFFLTGNMHFKSPLNKDRDFLATLLSHVPAGGSTNTVLHYSEIVRSGRFHAFGDPRREFPLKRVSAPLALFSSSNDGFVSVADVNKLQKNIGNSIQHVILQNQNVTHTEFVWGHQANRLVFGKVLEILESFTPGKKNHAI